MSERTPNGILPGQVTQLTTTLLPEPPFTIADNGHGQTITQGEPPRWSTTPPREPGRYWCHLFYDGDNDIAWVRDGGWELAYEPDVNSENHVGVLFWPVRLPEPPPLPRARRMRKRDNWL